MVAAFSEARDAAGPGSGRDLGFVHGSAGQGGAERPYDALADHGVVVRGGHGVEDAGPNRGANGVAREEAHGEALAVLPEVVLPRLFFRDTAGEDVRDGVR